MEHLWSLSNMTRVHVDSGLPYKLGKSQCCHNGSQKVVAHIAGPVSGSETPLIALGGYNNCGVGR
jgi:hypothetical protein